MLNETSQLEELRGENIDLKKALNFIKAALEDKKRKSAILLTLYKYYIQI